MSLEVPPNLSDTPAFRTLVRVGRSLLRNAIQAVPTIFVIVTAGFFLVQLAPGDAADFVAAEMGSITEQGMTDLRRLFGLDQPVLQQLWSYYAGLAQFSLGHSPRYGVPVLDLIMSRLPGTLLLMSVAIVVAVVLGLVCGTVMAVYAGRLPDRVLSVLSLLMYSLPTFWVGLMMIVLFGVLLGWLPTGGAYSIGRQLGGLDRLLDTLRYIALPALALGLNYVAIYARLTRAAVVEASGQDYVRTAVSKGLAPSQILRRHILRNALIPVTTLAGMHVGGILGGAVVVETVFSWPGMGRLAYEAVMAREYRVLLGILLVSSIMVILANALVDILHSLLDPKIGVH